MKATTLILTIIFGIMYRLSADEQTIDVHALNNFVIKDAKYSVYNPPVKIQGKYKNIADAKCLTPELLMESAESANSQEWINYNWLPDTKVNKVTPKQLKYRSSLDKNLYYNELQSKLTFSYNGVPSAIVKFYFVENGVKTILSSTFMQKKENRWYKAVVPMDLLNLVLVVQRIKPHIMLLLIANNRKEMHSDFLKNLSERIRKSPSGFIDMDLLYNESKNLITKKDYRNYLLICDKSFPDKKVK